MAFHNGKHHTCPAPVKGWYGWDNTVSNSCILALCKRAFPLHNSTLLFSCYFFCLLNSHWGMMSVVYKSG